MDKVVSICLSTCFVHRLLYFWFRFVFDIPPVDDIVLDSSAEQNGLLLHEGDLLVVPSWVQLFDIAAVKKHLAFNWLVKSFDHGDNGTLATARSTNQCNYSVLHGIHCNWNSLQHLNIFLAWIIELHVADFDRSLDFLPSYLIATCWVYLRLNAHNFYNFIRGP